MGSARKFREPPTLVDGLTDHERILQMHATLEGDRYHKGLVERVQDLESTLRLRELGWLGRFALKLHLRRN